MTTLPQYEPSRQLPQDVQNNERYISPSSSPGENGKRPLDLVQRLEKKLAAYNASQNIFKRWLFELASWLISAVCMGAVIGIYITVSGQEMTKSEQSLTVANTLGKIASAALIVPTSEALGQLKWNWFHKSNAMWDFEIFDKASRGAWGATLLLFRTKGRSLAALGALLIVLLLAIDTFFQQVVTFPDRWALQTAPSSIPIVKTYSPYFSKYFIKGDEIAMYDEVTSPVIKSYFYGNGSIPVPFGSGFRPDIPLSCPSSKCTWPTYDTLATCSSCVDVSHDLNITYACLNTTIDWSVKWEGPLADVPYPVGNVCGHFLNLTSATPILLSGRVVSENGTTNSTDEVLLVRTIPLSDMNTKEPYYGTGSFAFRDIRYPVSIIIITDGLVASASNGIDSVYGREPPVVHECMLSWCVQRVRSSYEWGLYSQTTESTFLNIANDTVPWPWIVDGNWYEYSPNITLEAPAVDYPDTNNTYSVWNETAFQIMVIWDDFFPSSYTAAGRGSKPILRFKEYPDGPATRFMDFNPWLAPSNVTRHMERLASSLTNVMRSNTKTTEALLGEAYDREKFVRINWPWLIFPLLLLLLSLVFLVATIIKTSNDTETGVWKTSALPTLIYGLPQDVRKDSISTTSSESASPHDPRKVRIRLLPKQGWRVSGQVHPASTVPPGFI
ncbi:uncharacterized protein J4E79_005449 [Alternaria viburni]|uniref:uncharacterized protein n=1 Tax=Alternaria viburni TaxID=566460 RepID=UPI0020C2154A|nr:uncharacterized protein J4E79_005449 [Alternaria viburni]KAI4660881.1 hypothetical protein J4E79_005449 [Alternaria viburni]